MKRRLWIALAVALLLAGCGNLGSNAVARVDSVVLTREDLDARVKRVQKGLEGQAAQGAPAPSALEIEQQLVDQFIEQQLVLEIAKQRGVTISEKEIDGQIDTFRTQIPQVTGGTLEDAVQGQLGLPGVASTEFRLFVSYFLAQTKIGETLVTTDTVRQRVTDEVMAEASKEVEKADVAHILVQTEDEAKAVIARLDKGEEFGALAAELSQDPGSKDNGGIYTGITRGQFVPEFEKAMFEDLQPGETTKAPVQTQFGWHVIRLISRTKGPAMTPDEANQAIEQRLSQALQEARGNALRDLITEERTKAREANRLTEPTYPTATPAVPEQPGVPTVTPAP